MISKSSINVFDNGSEDPDVIYFNGEVINSSVVDNGSGDPIIKFSDYRLENIITDASLYHMSIVKWNADIGANLPLFIPIISSGTTTVYSITMSASCGGENASDRQFVIYVSESGLTPISSTQRFDDKYYWIYSYQNWLDCVNTTLQSCFTNLQEQLQGLYGTFVTKCPKMMYDASTNRFSLYTDCYGFGEDDRKSKGISGHDESFVIYFNNNMTNLFKNFQNTYTPFVDESAGTTTKIIIRNKLGQNIVTDASNSDNTKYYVTSQEWASTDSWTPISGIVFRTNTMPVTGELISTVNQIGSPSSFSVITQSPTDDIITDISLSLTDGAHDYKQFLTYSPDGQYRLIDLCKGHGSMKTIDFSIGWKCKYNGQIYPCTMPSLGYAGIKIMFVRKK